MSETRIVDFIEGNAGIWNLVCPTCPLRVHAEAMGVDLPACAHGIITNMQGPFVLGTCPHYAKESAASKGKKLVISCEWRANP
jgi:hypothetical protein